MPQSALCLFLGYDVLHHGYRCFHIPISRVHISCHVLFHKIVFPRYVIDPLFSKPSLGFYLLLVPFNILQISNMIGLHNFSLPIVPSESV